jgi:hypothetical protein
MTSFSIVISARKHGALGVQSAAWRYQVTAKTFFAAAARALERAVASHSATHEHFMVGIPSGSVLEVNGRLEIRGWTPITIVDEQA